MATWLCLQALSIIGLLTWKRIHWEQRNCYGNWDIRYSLWSSDWGWTNSWSSSINHNHF